MELLIKTQLRSWFGTPTFFTSKPWCIVEAASSTCRKCGRSRTLASYYADCNGSGYRSIRLHLHIVPAAVALARPLLSDHRDSFFVALLGDRSSGLGHNLSCEVHARWLIDRYASALIQG